MTCEPCLASRKKKRRDRQQQKVQEEAAAAGEAADEAGADDGYVNVFTCVSKGDLDNKLHGLLYQQGHDIWKPQYNYPKRKAAVDSVEERMAQLLRAVTYLCRCSSTPEKDKLERNRTAALRNKMGEAWDRVIRGNVGGHGVSAALGQVLLEKEVQRRRRSSSVTGDNYDFEVGCPFRMRITTWGWHVRLGGGDEGDVEEVSHFLVRVKGVHNDACTALARAGLVPQSVCPALKSWCVDALLHGTAVHTVLEYVEGIKTPPHSLNCRVPLPADRGPGKRYTVNRDELSDWLEKIRKTDQFDKDDATSISKFVTHLRDHDPDAIMMYQEQDLTEKKAFILAFRASWQRRVLPNLNTAIIELDGTGSIMESRFYLYTLMSPDVDGFGVPFCHFIVSKKDEETLTAALQSVFRKIPDLTCRRFMVDMEAAERLALAAIINQFLGPACRVIVCWFHVKDAAQRWLRHKAKATDGNCKFTVDTLETLKHARTVDDFDSVWTTYSAEMERRGNAATRIKNHVNTEYISLKQSWALCFDRERIGVVLDVRTNNLLERWHGFLKRHLLEGERNMRVDRLLRILLEDCVIEHRARLNARRLSLPGHNSGKVAIELSRRMDATAARLLAAEEGNMIYVQLDHDPDVEFEAHANGRRVSYRYTVRGTAVGTGQREPCSTTATVSVQCSDGDTDCLASIETLTCTCDDRSALPCTHQIATLALVDEGDHPTPPANSLRRTDVLPPLPRLDRLGGGGCGDGGGGGGGDGDGRDADEEDGRYLESVRQLGGVDDDDGDDIEAAMQRVRYESDEVCAASPIKRPAALMVNNDVVAEYTAKVVDLMQEARRDSRVKGPTLRAVQKAFMHEITEYYRMSGGLAMPAQSSMQYGMPPTKFVPNEVTGRKKTATELGPGERHDPQEFVRRWGPAADNGGGGGGGE
mgnify:CR=1 FL=1